MQAVTDQFKAAVNAATRHLDVMLTVLNRSGTERVYTSNDALLSLKIVDGKTTGGFGLGGTICPSLTAELHKSAVVAVNDKITVQIVVKNGSNLTLASEFSVDDIKRRPDGTMQVTALGLMIKLGKNHVSSITYPASQYQLLSEIAARAGRQLHPTLESRLINNPTIESAPLKGKAEDGTTLYYTRRELLGYAAAINGGSAIIDQYGYLDIVRFADTGEVISADRAFREDITDSYEITDIAWNTTGLSYALDDDFDNGMVEFYNPLDYADSERDTIISNLDSELVGFGYEGAIIQKQGCGYYQVGDAVTYKDIGGTNHTLLIMGIVYSFSDGYFTETLYSLASSENRRQYAGNEVVSNQIGGGQANPNNIVADKLQTGGENSGSLALTTDRYYMYMTNSRGTVGKMAFDETGFLVTGSDDEYGTMYSFDFTDSAIRGTCVSRTVKSGVEYHPDINVRIDKTFCNLEMSGFRSDFTGFEFSFRDIQSSLNNALELVLNWDEFRVKAPDLLMSAKPSEFRVAGAAYTLVVDSSGMYINGKKVLTEE